MATPLTAPSPALALPWQADALRQQLAPLWPGLVVEVVAQTGSTNTDLLARARTPEGATACLRVAEHQTAGRGRQGKAWQSAAGASLTFSLAVPLAPASWSGLSLAVGLALAEALDPADAAPPGQPPRIALKWPNDLLLRQAPGSPCDGQPDSADAAHPLGRKLGGILIETVASGRQRIAVIGIGLNVLPRPADDTAGAAPASTTALSWGHASLHELPASLAAAQALACVAPALLLALKRFERDGFAPLQARYAARDVLAGQHVSTTLADLPQGVADGVDADGTLWLRTTDEAGTAQRRPLISGEVSVRPAAAAALWQRPC
jgi:BirA family biotin operon repressor/biotin-[acetyl-CoA-carboxylase] ligase